MIHYLVKSSLKTSLHLLDRFSDNSELRLITAQFNAMADDVEANRKKNLYLEKIASWQTIARKLAHEIKNPLGGIRGAAQLLERELADSPNSVENKQFTQIIINEADRLKNLLDRMVGPKDIPTKGDINIHKILEHVRQLVLAENEHVTISADYDPSVPELYADESMLIQVFLKW